MIVETGDLNHNFRELIEENYDYNILMEIIVSKSKDLFLSISGIEKLDIDFDVLDLHGQNTRIPRSTIEIGMKSGNPYPKKVEVLDKMYHLIRMELMENVHDEELYIRLRKVQTEFIIRVEYC